MRITNHLQVLGLLGLDFLVKPKMGTKEISPDPGLDSFVIRDFLWITLPKFNIATEKWFSKTILSYWVLVAFQGLLLSNFGRVYHGMVPSPSNEIRFPHNSKHRTSATSSLDGSSSNM